MTQCSVLLKYFMFVKKREQRLLGLGTAICEGMRWELEALLVEGRST